MYFQGLPLITCLYLFLCLYMILFYWTSWKAERAILCLVTQSCLTLCDSRECSHPGSSVQGILQARILEYVAKPSSKGPSEWTHVTCIAGDSLQQSSWGSLLQSLLKSMAIESVMLSNYCILCWSLLLSPSIFPSIDVFSIWLLTSGDQRIDASASATIRPMNRWGWFPLGLTSLISSSNRLSRVFSSTTIQMLNSSALSLLYGPLLWKQLVEEVKFQLSY